ncbi:unnamed protein product [Cochlearia groenlandica]
MDNGESNNHEVSDKKPSLSVVDRLKRDEWSEGAVSSLLEAYESKWVLRNRAKLKGQDWEDVAKQVSLRAAVSSHVATTKSPKTQTQCKNKIESMKKRYRSESASSSPHDVSSSWPLYTRLDRLLRGNASSVKSQPQDVMPLNCSVPLLLLKPSPEITHPPPNPPQPPANTHISYKSKEATTEMDTESNTPASYREEATKKMKRRRYKEEIAGSIRWLGEVVMRSERAKMETMKEIEKIRAESEAKRGEIDLKRTEIMAKTQLEIAKLFTSGHKDKGV